MTASPTCFVSQSAGICRYLFSLIYHVLGVGAAYEDGECTDGRAPLSDFKGVVDVVLKHTLFELVGMGTSCGCKKHSLSFDWRGTGLCRRCLVGAGMLIDEGTMEGEVKDCQKWAFNTQYLLVPFWLKLVTTRHLRDLCE